MILSIDDWNDVSQLQTRGGKNLKRAQAVMLTTSPGKLVFDVEIEGLDGAHLYAVSGEWLTRSLALSHMDIIKKTAQEPDGPERDWPAIWRKQLREHIERAPMIPQRYIDAVLETLDEHIDWPEE